MDVAVDQLKKAGNQKVVVSCSSAENAKKIEERLKIRVVDLKVAKPEKKLLTVIIRDVLKINSDEDIGSNGAQPGTSPPSHSVRDVWTTDTQNVSVKKCLRSVLIAERTTSAQSASFGGRESPTCIKCIDDSVLTLVVSLDSGPGTGDGAASTPLSAGELLRHKISQTT
ncbi:hypothetical protein EVAR_83134_1 [Eumeta japonica]|uniref:Uncharacterized protein n=1 Tax=Eumeta variegata TaxID=151549 RepID=A0A4C1YCC7_EUMVA|nr:hypothetical protein EVAR_83134_1 [Eumeta japonica]